MTAKWVQRTPPKYITARVATTNTSEVPRSGCRKDESSRCEAETEVAHRALPLRAPPGAIDDEPGKREH